LLTVLPPEHFHQILAIVNESIGGRTGITLEDAKALGIAPAAARLLLSAASFAAVSVGVREAAAEEFVAALRSSGLVQDSDGGLLEFCQLVVTQRSGIRDLLKRSQLASIVFPALTDFDVTVDVRLGFEDGRVAMAIPVALMHFDTDSRGQEIWFQLSGRQLERLVEDLNVALREVHAAERWIESKPQPEN